MRALPSTILNLLEIACNSAAKMEPCPLQAGRQRRLWERVLELRIQSSNTLSQFFWTLTGR